MKARLLFSIVTFFILFSFNSTAQDLGSEYIKEWKTFHPSKALSRGIHASIFYFEDLSTDNIQNWVNYNKEIVKKLSNSDLQYVQENMVDARLLRAQAQGEIENWYQTTPHQNSLTLYARLISSATNRVVSAEYLTVPEKIQIICQRLIAVQQLSLNAMSALKKVDRADVERGIRSLTRAKSYYDKKLPEIIKDWSSYSNCDGLDQNLKTTTEHIQSLISFAQTELLPKAIASSNILGQVEYERQLALYTDSSLSPETLATMALKEISDVKGLMKEVAQDYLKTEYPGRNTPRDDIALIRSALSDMEKDAPINATDYLEFWQELASNAVKFIAEHKIATLPKNQTLDIITAPESAGPAARIGWVASAPPFDPNPLTTLNLPSIPETLPKQEQIDFWASFNKPFNRMIVIHELFPGHYMQMKISRESPHPIRLLFPYGIYTEGWATFCEKVLLDAGWEAGSHMTLLAHLRKRLENANRAYTSVQVHTKGWTQDQVLEFSTNVSLVAPQFAKSLWGRLMSSPMQLTSYFLGGAQFTELLAAEKERLGDQFSLILFMDTIMKSGPIPIDEFSEIFKQTISTQK